MFLNTLGISEKVIRSMFGNTNPVDPDNKINNIVTTILENSQSVKAILEKRIHLNVFLDILLKIESHAT